jgi:hypothetical protein
MEKIQTLQLPKAGTLGTQVRIGKTLLELRK